MDKHTFYSYLIVGMTFAFGLSAQAQNKVTAPMKDVNQVIDNTLDSLNKAHTATLPILWRSIPRSVFFR